MGGMAPSLAERDDLLLAVLRAVLVTRVRTGDDAVAAAETASAAAAAAATDGSVNIVDDSDGDRSGVGAVTAFHALKLPQISVPAYVDRLMTYMFCSKPCWIAAMIYLDRLSARCGPIAAVTSMTVHRLLLTALVVAAKFYDDIFYDSHYYSRVGGITVAEANTLELEFLCGLDWGLVVDSDEYEAMEQRLLGEALASPVAAEAQVLALDAGLAGMNLERHPPDGVAPRDDAYAAPEGGGRGYASPTSAGGGTFAVAVPAGGEAYATPIGGGGVRSLRALQQQRRRMARPWERVATPRRGSGRPYFAHSGGVVEEASGSRRRGRRCDLGWKLISVPVLNGVVGCGDATAADVWLPPLSIVVSWASPLSIVERGAVSWP